MGFIPWHFPARPLKKHPFNHWSSDARFSPGEVEFWILKKCAYTLSFDFYQSKVFMAVAKLRLQQGVRKSHKRQVLTLCKSGTRLYGGIFDFIASGETQVKNFVKTFIADESGATAIEYGLLAALIAVVIIAGATALGTSINDLFSAIATCIKTPASCAL